VTCRRPKQPPEARKSDKNTANTQQVRLLYFDFNVFSAENRRLFSTEFQLHTNSHITLWLPVLAPAYRFEDGGQRGCSRGGKFPFFRQATIIDHVSPPQICSAWPYPM